MMSAAYYNEIDPFAAQWLRNLIAAGHIATGIVDERSTEDVTPNDLQGFTQCHFFAGIGVWSYALRRAGWPDDKPVWTGSCPCQPFSEAGKKKGFADERHLWPAFFHLISQCRPGVIFGEQVASKNGLAWFDIVQADLETENYASAAVDLCAASVGAAHIRQRLFFCATDANGTRLPWAYEHEKPREAEITSAWSEFTRIHATADWKTWLSQSGNPALVDGTAGRVGRTRAYGNAICAPVAQVFIRSYIECYSNE
ncbi:DNA cytosine methyltransferase [Photorhabdus akhurstii]|nr:DNA cytosine methyltransferase [Photorhabdus akhurstii]